MLVELSYDEIVNILLHTPPGKAATELHEKFTALKENYEHSQTLYVLTVNEGGNAEPVFVTTDSAKADTKFDELILDHCAEVDENDLSVAEHDMVEVGGKSYALKDDYGDVIVVQHSFRVDE